jgi:hypothetical protein
MRKISCWAKHHTAAARLYIVCIKLSLALLSYYTGITLYKMQLVIPYQPVYIAASVLLIAGVVFYPSAKKASLNKRWCYIRQKACDFMLPLSAVLLFTTWVNNADTVYSSNSAYGSYSIKHPSAQEILNSGKTKETLTKQEKRILKKEFFKQLKTYAAASISGNKAKAGEALKIILAIIAMVGLLYLLAALVCSLSCSGSDAAAAIVAVLGVVGIIWGFIAVLKTIKRGPKTNPKDKEK